MAVHMSGREQMNTASARRPVAIVTGAGGGMGAACACVLGRRYRLILAELDAKSLAAVTSSLRRNGTDVIGEVVGDISSQEAIAAVEDHATQVGGIDALVHAAGISPFMGSWDRILTVNLGATLDLLRVVEPHLRPGASAVLIASLGAQIFPSTPQIDAELRTVTKSEAVPTLEPLVRSVATDGEPLSLSNAAYSLSKYALMRLCEQRAARWGAKGARITSVSPGLIATSMGQMEASANPAAAGLAEQAPAGRWGTANDIADAVEFLLSDAAGFITGCDLRVDGGLTAYLKDYAT